MGRWHATLRRYQEQFSDTGRCKGDIMKGRHQWDLKTRER